MFDSSPWRDYDRNEIWHSDQPDIFMINSFQCQQMGKEAVHASVPHESTKVFVNPDGNRSDISEKMAAFFDYIKGNRASDEFTKRIDTAVEVARRHAEWRAEYMTLLLRDEEKRAEGFNLYDKLLDYLEEHPEGNLSDVASKFGCSIEMAEKVLSRIQGRKSSWRDI